MLNKMVYFVFLSLLSCCSFSLQAKTNFNTQNEANKLARILVCQEKVTPEIFESLIYALNGKKIVKNSYFTDAEYTLPDPLDLFNQQIYHLSMYNIHDNIGNYIEYSAVFNNDHLAAVAHLAGVTINEHGDYRKEVGHHDLIIRPEAGMTYLTCAYNKRGFIKNIKRNIQKKY